MTTLEAFEAEVRAFCDERLEHRAPGSDRAWGEGSDDVSVIEEMEPEAEETSLAAASAWRKELDGAGLAWVTGPPELGGRGLGEAYADVVRRVLSDYVYPDETLLSIGLEIVAPALAAHGGPAVLGTVVGPIQRGEIVACQLFSEPDAGSDLAGLTTRAERVDGGWRVTGQKVWSSGAHLSAVGELLARTGPAGSRHRGLTMMVLDMHAPEVRVRRLRQMTGGSSFNEVFLDGAFVPDEMVLGEPGSGWAVAMATLTRERQAVGEGRTAPAAHAMERLVELVAHTGRGSDPHVRARLAELLVREKVSTLLAKRLASLGGAGPEMSMAKLHFTALLRDIGDLAGEVLGPALVADNGAWGTYCWSTFVTGAPGMRVAGGTDQIQRNVVAERVLGLPRAGGER